MNESGIYKIQSKIKPKRIYIGSAINIKNRWHSHKSDLRLNKHGNKRLQNHYNKYGEKDLQFSIIIGCLKESLIENEQFFMDCYNPFFNICRIAGSPLGTKRSDEVKEKMRQKNLGRKYPFKRRSDNSFINTYYNISKEERELIVYNNKNIRQSESIKNGFMEKPLKYVIKKDVLCDSV
jgi:group I intron endonuclease